MRSLKTRVTWCLGAALGLMLLAAAPGSAQPASASALSYPATVCSTLSISTTTPHAGQSMGVSGTGFRPGSTVTLVLRSSAIDVGTATVAKDGTFKASITIPGSILAGRHLLTVAGGDPVCPVDPVSLTITSAHSSGGGVPSGGGSGPLAVTGSDVLAGLAIALALIGLGLLLNQRGRRRRRHRTGHAA